MALGKSGLLTNFIISDVSSSGIPRSFLLKKKEAEVFLDAGNFVDEEDDLNTHVRQKRAGFPPFGEDAFKDADPRWRNLDTWLRHECCSESCSFNERSKYADQGHGWSAVHGKMCEVSIGER